MFLFAAGGALLLQPLPGFNLFRQPARMMAGVWRAREVKEGTPGIR
jgi:hypothetical protein